MSPPSDLWSVGDAVRYVRRHWREVCEAYGIAHGGIQPAFRLLAGDSWVLTVVTLHDGSMHEHAIDLGVDDLHLEGRLRNLVSLGRAQLARTDSRSPARATLARSPRWRAGEPRGWAMWALWFLVVVVAWRLVAGAAAEQAAGPAVGSLGADTDTADHRCLYRPDDEACRWLFETERPWDTGGRDAR